MPTQDDLYEDLIARTRADAKALERKFKRMHPEQLQKIQSEAMVLLHMLPSDIQSTVREVIAQENKGVQGLGALGWAAAAGAVANIAAAVGNVGLSVYQLRNQRKDSKQAQRMQQQQVDAQNKLIEEQMRALRLQTDQAEAEADFARQRREAQERAMAEGGGGGAASGVLQKAGGTNTLLIGGAVVALAAVALMAR